MFSSRLPAQLGPNRVSLAVARARHAGGVPFDLTESNPTVVGINYPHTLVEALADEGGLIYRPHAFGTKEARAAAAATFAPVLVDPERVVLTASTSEAYSFLFKLLCNPGDEVLVPRPSYPLFDLLTGLDGVRPVPYRLDPQSGWAIDRESVERAIGPAVRAILLVGPNNPTGSMLRCDDREWLAHLAASAGVALISDEVFAQYPLAVRADSTSLVAESRALTFTLGGLSKSAGLPQMKLAWTVAGGPDDLVRDALMRLELIADSYLSVSTPVQVAASALMHAARPVQAAIHARVRQNLAALREAVSAAPALTLHTPEAGWSAVVRVPAILPEEELVVRLLEEQGVLVHPGFFFDVEHEAFVVVSLLPPPDLFAAGVGRLVQFITGEMA